MEIRVIAVRDPKASRDLSRCVIGPVDGLEQAVIHGPVPVPSWGKRRGHIQIYIDSWAESVAGFDGPRDLGLDGHDDDAWSITGGFTQNKPPPGVTTAEMTGFLSGARQPDHELLYDYEETSSESSGFSVDGSESPPAE